MVGKKKSRSGPGPQRFHCGEHVMVYVKLAKKYIPARIVSVSYTTTYYTLRTYKRLELVGDQERSHWHVYDLYTNSQAYCPVRPAKRTANFIENFFKKHKGEGIVF